MITAGTIDPAAVCPSRGQPAIQDPIAALRRRHKEEFDRMMADSERRSKEARDARMQALDRETEASSNRLDATLRSVAKTSERAVAALDRALQHAVELREDTDKLVVALKGMNESLRNIPTYSDLEQYMVRSSSV